MMTQPRLIAAAVAATALVSVAAGADDAPSFTYLAGVYQNSDLDSGGDGDGVGLVVSYEVGTNAHVYGTVGRSSIDTRFLDITGTSGSVGIGLHGPLGDKAAMFGRIGYVHVEVEVDSVPGSFFRGGGKADDGGLEAGFGVRARVVPSVELSGGVSYIDIDGEDSTSLFAGVEFLPVGHLGLGLSFSSSEDEQSISASIRYYMR